MSVDFNTNTHFQQSHAFEASLAFERSSSCYWFYADLSDFAKLNENHIFLRYVQNLAWNMAMKTWKMGMMSFALISSPIYGETNYF